MIDKAVIFDMDGVLIDSEPAYFEMNKKIFKEFGIKMDAQDYGMLVGMASVPMWTMLKEKYNLQNEVSDFLNYEKKRMYEILDSEFISEPMEGVVSLLSELLKKNCRLGIASSSCRENIEFVISKLGLKFFFEFIAAGDEVLNGKPSPDIFLKIAEKFNASPRNCFVIEDSKNGITAANSAGMRSIGFKNGNSNYQDLSNADILIQKFDDEGRKKILEFIEQN